MKQKNTSLILTGYRAKGVELYKTDLKPMGYVVAGLGFACLGVAVVPNGLGVLFYPLGFALLGLVGIRCSTLKKKIQNKLRFAWWKLRT